MIFEGIKSVANIHPLFVHFPIGLLMTSGMLFIAFHFIEKEELAILARYNLYMGSVFSVLTVLTGLIAEDRLVHNDAIHEAMETHEDIMITMTIISLCISVYIFFRKEPVKTSRKPVFLAAILIMMALLSVGADFGGKMVFKYGAATELFIKVNPELVKGHSHSHEDGEERHTGTHSGTDSGEHSH